MRRARPNRSATCATFPTRRLRSRRCWNPVGVWAGSASCSRAISAFSYWRDTQKSTEGTAHAGRRLRGGSSSRIQAHGGDRVRQSRGEACRPSKRRFRRMRLAKLDSHGRRSCHSAFRLAWDEAKPRPSGRGRFDQARWRAVCSQRPRRYHP